MKKKKAAKGRKSKPLGFTGLPYEQELNRALLSSQIEKSFEWRKWVDEIPYINFPAKWKVKVIPPFGGAVVRFLVHIPGMKETDRVSIYLDCYEMLGYFGEPHWEVYPDKNGDNARVAMNDIKGLLKLIAERGEHERTSTNP